MESIKKEKISDFTDLYVWQKGHLLAIEIYKITKAFPREELQAFINKTRSFLPIPFVKQSLKLVAFLILFSSFYILYSHPAHALTLRNPANNLGLVGYWALEDATGTKATDFSGRGNTGTMTNMDSATDWVDGRVGRALDFDGVDDMVTIGGPSSIYGLTTDLSVFAWVKTTDTSWEGFSSGRADGCGWGLASFSSIGGTGQLTACVGSWRTSDHSNVSDGQWHHVGYTLSSANAGTLQFYKDGSTDGAPITNAGSHAATGTSITMGSNQGGSFPFQGQLDEARIYSRVLSAAEVAALYNLGVAKVKARDNTGLVGYWSFEDATGTKATDFSGQGNTGTLTNGPTWVAGKRGRGISFDGINDYVTAGAAASTNLTSNLSIFAWIKTTSPGRTSIVTQTNGCGSYGALNGCFGIAIGGNTANRVSAYIAPNWRQGNSAVNDGKWHHVGYTLDSSYNMQFYFDGATDSSLIANAGGFPSSGGPFVIGSDAIDANYYTGSLDEVRVYNRALTAQQVADLYNAGATTANPTIKTVSRNGLVGYWNLDDGTSTIATDFSGNGSTGTLTNGPTWVTGKRGKAVSFDGTDDYLNLSNSAIIGDDTTFTISAWVKFSSIGDFSTIYGEFPSTGSQAKNYFGTYQSKIFFDQYSPDGGFLQGATTLTANRWYHAVYSQNGTSRTIYLDGVSDASDNSAETYSGAAPTTAYIGLRGAGHNTYFNGSIDEVRIYNRALSAEEIQLLYTIGK